MNVVVTGAAGKIGQVVVRRLTADGLRVAPFGAGGPRVDVRDEAQVLAAIREAQPSAVVHFAGRTPPAPRSDLVDDAARAARAVVAAAADVGASVVLASSASVYGQRTTGPSRESDEISPAGDYGEGKALAESTAGALAAQTGVPLSLLRIFNVAGPGMNDSLVTRLAKSTEAEPVQLRSLEGYVRDYVHVDDVADAVARVLALGPSGVVTWNIGSGVATSNRALLAALAPLQINTVASPVPDEIDVSWADISRARDDLGFSPRVDLGPSWIG